MQQRGRRKTASRRLVMEIAGSDGTGGAGASTSRRRPALVRRAESERRRSRGRRDVGAVAAFGNAMVAALTGARERPHGWTSETVRDSVALIDAPAGRQPAPPAQRGRTCCTAYNLAMHVGGRPRSGDHDRGAHWCSPPIHGRHHRGIRPPAKPGRGRRTRHWLSTTAIASVVHRPSWQVHHRVDIDRLAPGGAAGSPRSSFRHYVFASKPGSSYSETVRDPQAGLGEDGRGPTYGR